MSIEEHLCKRSHPLNVHASARQYNFPGVRVQSCYVNVPTKLCSVSRKTPFEQAWEEYRTTIKSSQTKKVKFIERCSQFASEWRDPVLAINEAITEVESQNYQKQSQKVVSKYLLPFVDALQGFTGIVDALSEFRARRKCPSGY